MQQTMSGTARQQPERIHLVRNIRSWARISVSALALAAVSFHGSDALAGCPAVTGMVTDTQYLAEGDSCTIAVTGAIVTSGDFADAISAWTSNAITNNGRISTSGSSSVGISGLENGAIVNNGAIATAGDYADAISLFNGNTITNAGNISTSGMFATGIVGFDSNTITNSGTITAGGEYAGGINLYSDNTILNSGQIATTGADGVAISLSDNNRLTNEGRIRTEGNSAHGVSMQGGNTITNSGQILTDGNAAAGILGFDGNAIAIAAGGRIGTNGATANGISLWDNNSITNAGIVVTTGDASAAIAVNDDNRITNTGRIEATGSEAPGITAGARNTIVNSGTISTGGAGAAGISVGQDNAITNDGAISTTGSNAPAITAGASGTTIINNGTLFSEKSWAIHAEAGNTTIINAGLISGHARSASGNTESAISFSGSGNVLTLKPGSRLVGLVNLGDGTTVNIHTEQPVILHVDDVTHGTFRAPGRKLVIDHANNRVIVPASNDYGKQARAGGMTIGLLADGVSGVLFGGAGGMETMITATSGSGKVAQASAHAKQASVLAGGFISRGKVRRAADWNTAYGGLMAVRVHPAPGFLVGMHGGGGHTKTEGQSGSDAWFLGMHARYAAHGAWLAGIVTTGQGGSSGSTFTYLDNLSPTGLRSFSTVRKAAFTSFEGRLGMAFVVPGAPAGLTLSPELMARVTRVKLKRQALAVPLLVDEKRRFTAFDGRAQLTAAFALPSTAREDVRLLVSGGVARHDEHGKAFDRTTGFAAARLQVHTADGVRFLIGGEGHVGKGGFVGYSAALSAAVRF